MWACWKCATGFGLSKQPFRTQNFSPPAITTKDRASEPVRQPQLDAFLSESRRGQVSSQQENTALPEDLSVVSVTYTGQLTLPLTPIPEECQGRGTLLWLPWESYT